MRLTSVMIGFALAMATISKISAMGDEDNKPEPIESVKTKVETKKGILIDVRERKEWDQGHLKAAVFVPLSDLQAWDRDGISDADREKLTKLVPRGSVVYCHCAAGARAVPGSELLKKLGYDARPLKQGYRDLVLAGFAVDSVK